MKPKDLKRIQSKIEIDGFDYAMTDYSAWGEVDDEEFHKLRRAFVEAREKTN